ncbi:hypothetical protein CENSYa_1683 [Cenarchaeum symbiosum A]|uniref:Uncharacterized protein n=1 Tax=Cenarchaeum symbiosum (strain A) TaxID=414004 RepID=A0RY83_CENSY|nr:hypothetical protein CENSYa_1683 [Cenarchaeum symbiosum A]
MRITGTFRDGYVPDSSSPQPSSNVVELFGGDKHIVRILNSSGKPDKYEGTIAIGASNQSYSGVVVAAHSIDIEPGHTFRFHDMTGKESNLTKFLSVKHGMARQNLNIDAAFIPITATDITMGSKVRAHDGTVTEVIWGRLADVERLQEITIYGWYNNGPGDLMYKNATYIGDGIIFRNVGIGTYPSQGGDSGSAIVYHGGIRQP